MRVLMLGHTGLDKAKVIGHLVAQNDARGGSNVRVIDFERDYLQKQSAIWRGWTAFLEKDLPDQVAHWDRAWAALEESLPDGEPCILSMHATYASQHYGARSLLNISKICQKFRPTLVVTLIDDVFNAWRRTEKRAQGDYNVGKPKPEELLFARRAESLVGEVVAGRANPPARHVVFATGNADCALYNLVFHGAPVTYLSFPISAPRRLELAGDFTFSEMLNHAHARAYQIMMADTSRCFVTPLSIDEKPFAKRARDAAGNAFQFHCESDRWDVRKLWPAGRPCREVEDEAFVFDLNEADASAAAAIIDTDVGWRDRKLVCQSRNLAVLCPRDPRRDEVTGGVAEELQVALQNLIRCSIWQDDRWDSDGYIAKAFAEDEPGAMGVPLRNIYFKVVDSLDSALAA